jgi:hypothetical protein
MTGPTRTSQIVGRSVLAMVILGLGLTMCASPRAAEVTPPIAWVLWDETRNTAWTSPKGHEARTTTATACAIATVEAAKYVASGTKLACRKTK